MSEMTSTDSQLYQCQHCGNASSIQSNQSDYSEFHACPSCGLTSQESSFKMQEELARMFNQSMNVSDQWKGHETQASQPTEPIAYSITQHYHHSAHLATAEPPAKVPATSATKSLIPSQEQVKEVLVQHGINPSRLISSQLALFQQAAPDQQSRLLQLWSISPPEYADMGAQELTDELGAWEQTTIDQEEEMARLRYQRKLAQGDISKAEPQTGQQCEAKPETTLMVGDFHAVEPYITSGYELLAQRDYDEQRQSGSLMSGTSSSFIPAVKNYSQAMDPAFQSRGWWEVSYEQPLEHQYGMFDQMKQFQSPMQTAGGLHGQEDEEML